MIYLSSKNFEKCVFESFLSKPRSVITQFKNIAFPPTSQVLKTIFFENARFAQNQFLLIRYYPLNCLTEMATKSQTIFISKNYSNRSCSITESFATAPAPFCPVLLSRCDPLPPACCYGSLLPLEAARAFEHAVKRKPRTASMAVRGFLCLPEPEVYQKTPVLFCSEPIYLRLVYPMRYSSTSAAAARPSAMAQTTRDWPRCMSPAVNTFSTLV